MFDKLSTYVRPAYLTKMDLPYTSVIQANSHPLTFCGTHESISNEKKINNLSWGIYFWKYVREGLIREPHVDCRHSIWLEVWTL